MKIYLGFFFFTFFQRATRYNCLKLTRDSVCKNGYLIQMSNHFECKCSEGYALLNEDTCEKVVHCNSPEDEYKTCGNYAKCIRDESSIEQVKFMCTCTRDYIMFWGECVSPLCNFKICGDGKCIVAPDYYFGRKCSCYIGIVEDKNDNCTKPGQTDCALKCKKDEKCKLTKWFYTCVKNTSDSESIDDTNSSSENISNVNSACSHGVGVHTSDEETTVTDYSDEETAVTGSTDEETTVTDYNDEETTVTDYSDEETAVTGSIDEETTVTDYSDEETAVTGSIDEETTVTGSIDEETTVTDSTDTHTSFTGTAGVSKVVGGSSGDKGKGIIVTMGTTIFSILVLIVIFITV
ncbi:sexual stage surface protein Pvs28 [Plasmodium ovale wallikeri]|uniref:Sexual stage surface protein Pvs28 n=1 Tax=Plasmodium ovale wallikeri TaxID=864142 RepID=A0A1A8YHZ5_PLAOA|nr:sexual stage surface protein Pvs28 [Plasmodium ovale wallikeri]